MPAFEQPPPPAIRPPVDNSAAGDSQSAANGDFDVPYGELDGFEDVLRMIESATPGMLDEVRRGLAGRA